MGLKSSVRKRVWYTDIKPYSDLFSKILKLNRYSMGSALYGHVFLDTSVLITRTSLLNYMRNTDFLNIEILEIVSYVNWKLKNYITSTPNIFVFPEVHAEYFYGLRVIDSLRDNAYITDKKTMKKLDDAIKSSYELIDSLNVFDLSRYLRNGVFILDDENNFSLENAIDEIIPLVPKKNGRQVSRTDVIQIGLAMELTRREKSLNVNVSADAGDFKNIYSLFQEYYQDFGISLKSFSRHKVLIFPKRTNSNLEELVCSESERLIA